MKIFLLIIFTLVFWPQEAVVPQGQEKTEGSIKQECKQLVLDAYGKLPADGTQGMAGQGQMLEYRTTTTYKALGETKPKSTVSTSRITQHGNLVHLLNGPIEIAKDQDMAVSVHKERRQILISKTPPAKGKSVSQLEAMRELFLKGATVSACNPEAKGGTQVVTLLPSAQVRDTYKVKEIKFWVEPGEKEIRQIELVYAPGQPLERNKIEFLKPEKGARQGKELKKPLDLVYNAKGALLPQYKNFKVVDTRQRKG